MDDSATTTRRHLQHLIVQHEDLLNSTYLECIETATNMVKAICSEILHFNIIRDDTRTHFEELIRDICQAIKQYRRQIEHETARFEGTQDMLPHLPKHGRSDTNEMLSLIGGIKYWHERLPPLREETRHAEFDVLDTFASFVHLALFRPFMENIRIVQNPANLSFKRELIKLSIELEESSLAYTKLNRICDYVQEELDLATRRVKALQFDRKGLFDTRTRSRAASSPGRSPRMRLAKIPTLEPIQWGDEPTASTNSPRRLPVGDGSRSGSGSSSSDVEDEKNQGDDEAVLTVRASSQYTRISEHRGHFSLDKSYQFPTESTLRGRPHTEDVQGRTNNQDVEPETTSLRETLRSKMREKLGKKGALGTASHSNSSSSGSRPSASAPSSRKPSVTNITMPRAYDGHDSRRPSHTPSYRSSFERVAESFREGAMSVRSSSEVAAEEGVLPHIQSESEPDVQVKDFADLSLQLVQAAATSSVATSTATSPTLAPMEKESKPSLLRRIRSKSQMRNKGVRKNTL